VVRLGCENVAPNPESDSASPMMPGQMGGENALGLLSRLKQRSQILSIFDNLPLFDRRNV
jgi:hypothetical protein